MSMILLDWLDLFVEIDESSNAFKLKSADLQSMKP